MFLHLNEIFSERVGGSWQALQGKVRGGAWTLQGDAKKLFIPSAQEENSTDPGCPSKDKKVLEKH